METVTYQCPNCGAPLSFESETQRWDCKFCLSSFAREQLEGEEGGAESPAPEEDAPEEGEEASQAHYCCPNCGARVVTDQTTAATFCMFCGSPTILPEQVSHQFRPQCILPFQIDSSRAEELLRQRCRKSVLLPGPFHRESQLKKVTGVYLPFWLFDCRTSAQLDATGEHVTTWSDRKYHYTKVDVFHIKRAGRMEFCRVPADGSRKTDDDLMDAVEPFDYQALKPFSMAYLSGYYAEKYDQEAGEVYPRVEGRISDAAKSLLMETVQGYTSVRTTGFQVQTTQENCRYAMLPVWLLVTSYRGREYTLAINGQTGKMAGSLPLSWYRLGAVFGAVWAASALLVKLIGGLLL